MYPSGEWRGFWEQPHLGRQPMRAFLLQFAAGQVTGRGVDLIGPFQISGHYEATNGQIRFVKQYLGKHRVEYVGQPDGEGSIGGTWYIRDRSGKAEYQGPFLIQPVLPAATDEDPILPWPQGLNPQGPNP